MAQRNHPGWAFVTFLQRRTEDPLMTSDDGDERMGNPPMQPQYYAPPPGRERRSRRLMIGLGVLAGAFVLSVVGLFVWADAAMLASGCGSIDPTDPMNYSTVAISNDSSVPVVVDECVGLYCDPDAAPVTLRPGQQDSVHAACGTTGSDMTSWRVTTATGTPLGYIAVDTPRSSNGLIFPVSVARASRATAASPAP